MSDISEHAAVSVLMADYANVDESGKLNIIGGGLALLGFDPYQETTPRFCLVVTIDVTHEFVPADFVLEIALTDDGGVISLPTETGEEQPVRVANSISLERAQGMPTTRIRDHVGATNFTVLDFSNGLPLTPGVTYNWRVSIDGDTENSVGYPFAIPGAPDGPVMG